MAASERITIRGTSNGLVVTIGPGDWQSLIDELDGQLGERASFFKGGRVGLDVGPRQLSRSQIEAIGKVLNGHQVTLWAVESESLETKDATIALGLETRLTPARPVSLPSVAAEAHNNAMLIQRTVRSGQVIHHPGHVVIIGDVNPGAEIKAGGSVIVWGRLRGLIQAGAAETYRESAVVCALQLAPMQLRIGDYIARAPADDDAHDFVPEIASIQGGQIVAEPWNS
jgi:septum site-determining protein MinC